MHWNLFFLMKRISKTSIKTDSVLIVIHCWEFWLVGADTLSFHLLCSRYSFPNLAIFPISYDNSVPTKTTAEIWHGDIAAVLLISSLFTEKLCVHKYGNHFRSRPIVKVECQRWSVIVWFQNSEMATSLTHSAIPVDLVICPLMAFSASWRNQ